MHCALPCTRWCANGHAFTALWFTRTPKCWPSLLLCNTSYQAFIAINGDLSNTPVRASRHTRDTMRRRDHAAMQPDKSIVNSHDCRQSTSPNLDSLVTDTACSNRVLRIKFLLIKLACIQSIMDSRGSAVAKRLLCNNK